MSSSTKPPQVTLNTYLINNLTELNSSDRMFRALAHAIKEHPLSKLLPKYQQQQSSSILQNKNTIKVKMLVKLINWMQKICFTILHFSQFTYEISIRILIAYLDKTSQSPNCLQLLGCVALHLSSKLNQKTIISIDSYRECCMNIFTKKEFQQKQCEVYKKLNEEISYTSMFQILDFLDFGITQNKLLSKNQRNKIQLNIRQFLKEIQLIQVSPIDIVSNLFIQIYTNPQFQATKEQILTLAKLRTIQY